VALTIVATGYGDRYSAVVFASLAKPGHTATQPPDRELRCRKGGAILSYILCEAVHPMLTLLQLLLLALQGGLAAIMLYLLLLTAAAVAGRRTLPAANGVGNHVFLILVPAHNEAQLLPGLLQSLERLDYPRALYAVHVVADNCTDETAAVARQWGATVHERNDSNRRGKGAALQWLLERLWATAAVHDAVVFLDADSHISPNFLRVMDSHLARGERVIQAYYTVDAPERARSVALRYAAFAVLHYLRPLGRMALGASVGLKGNGMVFAAELMRAHQWSAALTEDIELHMALLFAGERVAFAPGATVWAEMPASLAQTTGQHARWESGRLEMARRYVPPLLRASWVAARQGEMRRAFLFADAALEHLIPPLAVFAALTLFGCAVTLLLSLGMWLVPAAGNRTLLMLNLLGSTTLLAGLLLYLFAGLRLAAAPWPVYRSLLGAPLYIIWKSRHYVQILNKRSADWVRTTRNHERWT
jgi:cellulose synthase/poly-beta-1,6-N-acetylglucosamine synthase-like glycosyltransferase